MATVFLKPSAVVVGGVLLCERHRIVASGTRSEWRRKGAALVLLRVHEQRVAGIEGGKVVEVASLFYTGVSTSVDESAIL